MCRSAPAPERDRRKDVEQPNPPPAHGLWGTGTSLGHKPFSPSNPTCTRFHCGFTGSERSNQSPSPTKPPLAPAPPSFPTKHRTAATLHPRAVCILEEPRSGGSTKTRCLSDLHAVHVDAEVDLELSTHLDDPGHAVEQHVVELGRGGRGLVGAQHLPAQSCGLPWDLGSFTPLGLSWSLGRIQPKK